MNSETKLHWEHIYENKTPEEVSWTQETPQTSLDFIHSFGNDKSKSIIDVGGGDSKLVDFLLNEGYTDITVLDISANALERAKQRLGDRADKVKWIVSDITEFNAKQTYDIWHDRAVFHFLTTENQVQIYQNLVSKIVNEYLIVATFSTNGPLKCSGLEIKQNDMVSLGKTFACNFELMTCKIEDHKTPFNTFQNFIYCSFKKK